MSVDIYAEEIVSNYEHPHNKRKIENAAIALHDYNPVCGDDITMYANTDGDKITEVSFEGSGCAISIGTASMLTEFLKGKSLDELRRMDAHTVIELIGVDPGPVRLKCATLSLKTLQKALILYDKTHKQ